jgi:bis(5'-nucleosyl)-tetraphosphatase (symmetrical)
MPTYLIGDVHGCLIPLQRLLEKIQFSPANDQLWFSGDLVNRGPHSLDCLRFIKQLPQAITVLGNHDLALLAADVKGSGPYFKPEHPVAEILQAPDKEQLLTWLRHQPLLHHSPTQQFTLVHAGLAPQWTIAKARALAKEVELLLQGPHYKEFLQQIMGNTPALWQDDLSGWPRARLITNVLTRIRYCRSDGALDFTASGPLNQAPVDCVAWFDYPKPAWQGALIAFGHWAALQGHCPYPQLHALDTGCAWGEQLTALCLETQQRFHIDCKT